MLEKCKFCGNIPKFKEKYEADRYYIGKKNFVGYYLKCPYCGYETTYSRGYDNAAKNWNESNKVCEKMIYNQNGFKCTFLTKDFSHPKVVTVDCTKEVTDQSTML